MRNNRIPAPGHESQGFGALQGIGSAGLIKIIVIMCGIGTSSR